MIGSAQTGREKMVQIDIEMPVSCEKCPFFDQSGAFKTCIITQHALGYKFRASETRMDDCPIQDAGQRENELKTLAKLFSF